MKILFVTGQAHFPQSYGGVQASTEATIRALSVAGHKCAVACALWGNGTLAWRARLNMLLFRSSNVRDDVRDYPVFRSWQPVKNIQDTVKRFEPTVAVVQHMNTVPFVEVLHSVGIPVVVYLRNLEFEELGGDLSRLPKSVQYIANSQFTAQRYRDRFGIEPFVLPPLIEPDRYRAKPGRYVTMINPALEKGVDLFLSVVERCPDIPFMIVEGWGNVPAIMDRIRSLQSRGSSLVLVKKTDDMRSVYAQTKILMAPSQWEEAWGRVASEAHISGIPVIGSDRGGLPEAIGPGGIIVSHDASAVRWAEAVHSLWHDDAAWKAFSDAAAAYATRDEMQVDGHIDRLIQVISSAVKEVSTTTERPS